MKILGEHGKETSAPRMLTREVLVKSRVDTKKAVNVPAD